MPINYSINFLYGFINIKNRLNRAQLFADFEYPYDKGTLNGLFLSMKCFNKIRHGLIWRIPFF